MRPAAIAPAMLSTPAPASFYLVHPWTRTAYIPVGNAALADGVSALRASREAAGHVVAAPPRINYG